jgi:hypothetical protein
MADREHVRQLMAGCLDCSILDFSGNLVVELTSGIFREVGVMSGITLNADSPTLLGHSKHECPPVLGVEISIRKDEQALVIRKLDVLFQVVEDLPCMILLHSRVCSDSSCHHFILGQLRQIE